MGSATTTGTVQPQGWTQANLATQGYRLPPGEAAALRIGLRFATALCLTLVVTGLLLESALMIALLVPIGIVAGWTSRHPFDLLWNHAVRHVARAPALPPNPARRRHAFKLATLWLAAVALLLVAGIPAAALVLGGALTATCLLVTLTNFCVPSTVIARWEARRRGEVTG